MYLHQSSNTCDCAFPPPSALLCTFFILVPCHSLHRALHTYYPSLSLPPPLSLPLSPHITTPFVSYYRVQTESTSRIPAQDLGVAEAMVGEALDVTSLFTHTHTTGMDVIEMSPPSLILAQDLDSSSSSSATRLRTEQDQNSSSSSSSSAIRLETEDTTPASASPEAAFQVELLSQTRALALAMKDVQKTMETLHRKVEALDTEVSSIKANSSNDESPPPLMPAGDVQMGRGRVSPDIDISGPDSDVDLRAVSKRAIPLPCPYSINPTLPTPPPTPTYPPQQPTPPLSYLPPHTFLAHKLLLLLKCWTCLQPQGPLSHLRRRIRRLPRGLLLILLCVFRVGAPPCAPPLIRLNLCWWLQWWWVSAPPCAPPLIRLIFCWWLQW